MTSTPEWHLVHAAEWIRICADHQEITRRRVQRHPTEGYHPGASSVIGSTGETIMSVAALSASPDARWSFPVRAYAAFRFRLERMDRSRLGRVTARVYSLRGQRDPRRGRAKLTPFDDLVTAVSTSRRAEEALGPLPPARRFMVRVAQAESRPHRPTKRNYDSSKNSTLR